MSLNDAVRSAPAHPDHEDPWALQLVVHRVKADPAQHRDVLAAAATAVVRLLDDARSHDGGPWASAMAHWRAGWIRKVTRRAENKRWEDVQALPGVTVSLDTVPTAEVRAIVPGPLTPLPSELKKLQVGGTEFPRTDESAPAEDPTAGPTSGPTQTHNDAVVTVMMAPGLVLSTGKAAAQAGHAAQLAYERLRTVAAGQGPEADTAASLLQRWRDQEFRVRVLEADEQRWATTFAPVQVIDAGLTEVTGPTETARALW